MRTTLWRVVLVTALGITCFSCQQPKGALPFIDVRENYPKKEILLTDDIADITYLHLSTDDNDYLHNDVIPNASTNTIFIYDFRTGNILFFGKDGKPKSRFNRTGNGPGEYRYLHRVFYDEGTDDVYVFEPSPGNVMHVYSSTGTHKRDFSLPEGTVAMNDIVSFDKDAFFFYDHSIEMKNALDAFENGPLSIQEPDIAHLYLISKADGSVLDLLELSISPVFIGAFLDGMKVPPPRRKRLINSKEGILICNHETDTVFLYGKDRSLTPVIHKTPLVATTDPRVYLNNCVELGSYQFIQVCTSIVRLFPTKYYIRDKKTGEIFEQKLLLPDYKGGEFTVSPYNIMNGMDDCAYFEMDITELQQAYSENRLTGKLKDLVATLKEDDNNVYAIVHFK